MYKYYIAFKYLYGRWVNYLAVFSVAIAVAAFVVVVAVMEGLLMDTRASFRGTLSDLIVRPWFMTIDSCHRASEAIRSVDHVKGASPFIEGKGVVRIQSKRGEDQKLCQIYGADYSSLKGMGFEQYMEEFASLAQHFRYDPSDAKTDKSLPAIIGSEFAFEIEEGKRTNVLRIGQTLKASMLSVAGGKAADTLKDLEFRVLGFFNSGDSQLDSSMVFIPLRAAQHVFGMEGRVSGIDIFTDANELVNEDFRDNPQGYLLELRERVNSVAENVFADIRDHHPGNFVIRRYDELYPYPTPLATPHLRLEPNAGAFEDYEKTLKTISAIPHVKGLSPFIQDMAIFKHDSVDGVDRDYVHFKGIDLKAEFGASELENQLKPLPDGRMPTLDFTREQLDAGEEPPILVGLEFKIRDNKDPVNMVRIGDKIQLITSNWTSEKEPDTSLFPSLTFRVAGFFRTGVYEIDRRQVYVPLVAAQHLKSRELGVMGIAVALDDYANAEEVKKELNSIGFLNVHSWEDEQEITLRALKNQNSIITFLMFFLTILSGFLILAILSMVVYQKFKDIGILKSMGATLWGVMTLFMINGFFIGLIGSALGALAGWGICRNVNFLSDLVYRLTGFQIFPRDVFYLGDLHPYDTLGLYTTAVLSSMAISVLASAYPAFRAGSLDPVKALRQDL